MREATGQKMLAGKKKKGLLVAVHIIEMRQQQVRGKAFRVPEEHSICCVSASVWINHCLSPERARSRRGDGSGAPRGLCPAAPL